MKTTHPSTHIAPLRPERKCPRCKGTGRMTIRTGDEMIEVACPLTRTHRELRYRRHYLRVFFARRGRVLPRKWMELLV
jgi:hypothetical protein